MMMRIDSSSIIVNINLNYKIFQAPDSRSLIVFFTHIHGTVQTPSVFSFFLRSLLASSGTFQPGI